MSKNRKKLIDDVDYWKNKSINDWDTIFLNEKRFKSDDLADQTIKQIFSSTDPEHINAFYGVIQRNSDEIPEKLPAFIKNYFKDHSDLPSWASPYMLKKAEDFYATHGGMIALVLCVKSLPECYACAKGAHVLYNTGRLSEKNGSLDPFTRRIAETAQFIVDVMSPNGLSPKGKGIRSAQKVRLIHAAIRHYIYKGEWDEAYYGKPINQADMAGTLMSFAPLVIEGLETLGVKVSDVEKESYFHSWRVVGYFMGLDEDLLPNNISDAFALGNAIFENQKMESDEGKHLTICLIEFMSQMSENKEILIIVDDLLRMMLGDKTADLLGVPNVSHKTEWIENKAPKLLLGGWENMIERHSILKRIAKPLNIILLNGMLRKMNNHQKINFFIPPSLQEDWNLKSK